MPSTMGISYVRPVRLSVTVSEPACGSTLPASCAAAAAPSLIVRVTSVGSRHRPAGVPRAGLSDDRPVSIDDRTLARMIDHTLLKPEAVPAQIERLGAEALEHGFAAVCVNGAWVPLAARLVSGSEVAVAAVAGFPLGAGTSAAKAFE